ncbi:vacuolar protein sorting-associated protein 26c [Anaeramoeba flamelloides]|uniref:Vacuolar protein sorting-associated protein 26c n=1 Tax=Anaeramoeba flamelloides TaxID=1746091 RepID=A0ABQ8XAB1_9EUKA|nr:vacuolar protein sorting-associated protein 26c [Anaeramoeba flamelloides]
MATITLKLKKQNQTYTLGDTVIGSCVIETTKEISHNGIKLYVHGQITMREIDNDSGILDNTDNIPSYKLLFITFPLSKVGKLLKGETEIPFEFVLQPLSENKLIETYHGANILINYILSAVILRGRFYQDITESTELIAKIPPKINYTKLAKEFIIDQNSVQKHKKIFLKKIGDFQIRGQIHSLICPISKPFSGYLQIVKNSNNIKTIDVELVRTELCRSGSEKILKDLSEIQSVQIVDGNITHDLEIPIFMLFPKLFTCPTVDTKSFKVTFQINIIVQFTNNFIISENFEIDLIRTN